jgi:hypothetical protein
MFARTCQWCRGTIHRVRVTDEGAMIQHHSPPVSRSRFVGCVVSHGSLDLRGQLVGARRPKGAGPSALNLAVFPIPALEIGQQLLPIDRHIVRFEEPDH